MTTRAQELIADAIQRSRAVERCYCKTCDDWARGAVDLARAALLATLRKQYLRLAYVASDAERHALLHDLRIVLDTRE